MPEASDKPFVSVVIPVLNEAEFIERAVRSLLENDYLAERMEILVVDGRSEDETRDIVNRLSHEDPRVHLLDNPHRIQACAMNVGIKAAKGDVIIRLDGHAAAAPDFVSQVVRVLQEHPEVWCAGGVMETVGLTYAGRVIAAAMSCPIGVGGRNFRLGRRKGYIESVPFGAHRREAFQKAGLFDEELSRNEDDEHIQRMLEAGGKFYMDPSIRSQYFSRASFWKLAKQYLQYGFWRIRTIQKRGHPAAPRQLLPLGFVVGWAVLIVGSLLWHPLVYALVAYGSVYGVVLLAGATEIAIRKGLSVAILAPFAIAIMHFSYGLGSLRGIWSWGILRGRFVPKRKDYPLTR